jgi:hypothetical protein
MLLEFEQAKRELAEIRAELKSRSDPEKTSSSSGDIKFLRSRVLDLLKDIYVDSPSTLDHIKEVFSSAETPEVLSMIDRALKASPPLRQALSSEEDGRAIIALVDAAVWRSRIVWGAGAIALLAAVVVFGTLGINISGLSSQAEAVRKFFDDAKAQSEHSIQTMTEGVNALQRQTADFEKNRSEIGKRIDSLNSILSNPNSEINKVVAGFTTELARLKELEQDWSERRVALSAALSRHEAFLAGREADVTQKTSDLLQHASGQATAIETAAGTAKRQQGDVEALADSSKRTAGTIQTLVSDAGKNVDKIEGLKQRAEASAAAADTAGARIKSLQQESEDARARIGSAGDEIGKRSRDVVNTATTALAEIDAAKKDFAQKGTLTLSTLGSLQSTAENYATTIQSTKDAVTKQQQEIARLLLDAGQQETAITAKLEEIKTEQVRQHGELDRAKLDLEHAYQIIKIVDDKHTDVSEKLQHLLEERPSLDVAAAWKLVLGSYVFLVLAGALAVLLLALVLALFGLARAWRRRPAIPTTTPTGAA